MTIVADATSAGEPQSPPAPGGSRSTRPLAVAHVLAFAGLHVACLSALVVGVDARALLVMAVTYAVRCFGIGAGFHRYFSHRAFRTSRAFQLALALAGTLAMQGGVLWWASTHRRHHAVADTPADVHSPHHHGFLYSHCGWALDPANHGADLRLVRDLARYPELVWLDRWRFLPPAVLAVGLYALGPTVFVWGFLVSTVALYHATLATGSFSHRVGGYRNFETRDDSRNNRLIAAVMLGEGWHNNHHHRPRAALHGWRRSELDPIGGGLRLLAATGLVRDLRPGLHRRPPAALGDAPAARMLDPEP